MDSKKAYQKLQRYCAYQERCIQEVKQKLTTWQINQQDQVLIIDKLIDENFVDEERFADIYTRSKFSLKKWGRQKIKQNLQLKNIPTVYIEKADKENIPSHLYQETITTLIQKKLASLSTTVDLPNKRNKIARYLLQKGYESHLIWPLIHQIVL